MAGILGEYRRRHQPQYRNVACTHIGRDAVHPYQTPSPTILPASSPQGNHQCFCHTIFKGRRSNSLDFSISKNRTIPPQSCDPPMALPARDKMYPSTVRPAVRAALDLPANLHWFVASFPTPSRHSLGFSRRSTEFATQGCPLSPAVFPPPSAPAAVLA